MKILFPRAAFLAIAFACASSAFAETRVSVNVTPGPRWVTTSWFFLVPVKHAPQMAVWIRDSDGAFVTTISATESAARKKWYGDPDGGRPESLPVWYHAANLGQVGVDAISSASTKDGSKVARSASLVAGKEYVAYLEINSSFDYNDFWSRKAKPGEKGYCGVNGQPSLVYAARFVAGDNAVAEFAPIGRGSADGSDGAIYEDMETITNASQILGNAQIGTTEE